jgi:hypothetical protein
MAAHFPRWGFYFKVQLQAHRAGGEMGAIIMLQTGRDYSTLGGSGTV